VGPFRRLKIKEKSFDEKRKRALEKRENFLLNQINNEIKN